jgi:transposase-like protein
LDIKGKFSSRYNKSKTTGGVIMKNLSKEEKQQMAARYHAGESVSEICYQTGSAQHFLYMA